MKNLRKILVSCLVLLALVFVSAPKVHAAADIAVASAKVTSANTVLVTFANPGQNLASTVAADYHIDINTGGTSPLTPSSAVVTSATLWTVTLTFSGTPFSNTASAYDSSHGLYLDAGAVTDTNADTNAVVLHSASTAITDGQLPTFTANRTALNTIVLTYSESISETAIANSYTVAGASAVTNSAVVAGTSVTLTTTGLTSTSGTPAVNYVAATGDVADAAANEAANGGAVAATDHVVPVFVSAVATSDTNIQLTFSEAVTVTHSDGSDFDLTANGVVITAATVNAFPTKVDLTTNPLVDPNFYSTGGLDIASGAVKDISLAQNSNASTQNQDVADGQVPETPTANPGSGSYFGTQNISLSSVGSQSIRYTLDGSNPDCSTGTVYTGPISVGIGSTEINAIGCDNQDNSSVLLGTFDYSIASVSHHGGGGGGGGGSSSSSSSTATTVACAPGQAFSSTTGAKCTTTVAPVTCAPGAMFSATTGEKCSPATVVFCSAGQMFNATSGAQCTTYLPADSGTTASSFGITLVKLGTTGDACKAWQTYFNAHGATLTVDGNCGPKTIAFAKTWQASVGITADGVLGAVSRSKAI